MICITTGFQNCTLFIFTISRQSGRFFHRLIHLTSNYSRRDWIGLRDPTGTWRHRKSEFAIGQDKSDEVLIMWSSPFDQSKVTGFHYGKLECNVGDFGFSDYWWTSFRFDTPWAGRIWLTYLIEELHKLVTDCMLDEESWDGEFCGIFQQRLSSL